MSNVSAFNTDLWTRAWPADCWGKGGIQGLAAALQGVNHNLNMSQQDLAVVKMLNVNTAMFTQNYNF